MVLPGSLDPCFSQGHASGLKNDGPSSCPNYVASDAGARARREAWLNGWRQGQIDRQKLLRTPQPEVLP